MSSCFFISSNTPLKEVADSNATINLDRPKENAISIEKMSYDTDEYSGMKYANEINYLTLCQAHTEQLLAYIKDTMIEADTAEIWSVWLPEYGVPVTKTKEVAVDQLTAEYLYGYLMKLETSPYVTELRHEEDEENSIYYRLKISK